MTSENLDWMKKQKIIYENLTLVSEIILKTTTQLIKFSIKESPQTWLNKKNRLSLNDKHEWELIILKWEKIQDILYQCIMQHTKNFLLILHPKLLTKIFERPILFLEKKEFHIKQLINEITHQKKENEMLIHLQSQEDSKTLIFSLEMIIQQKSLVLIFITYTIQEVLSN